MTKTAPKARSPKTGNKLAQDAAKNGVISNIEGLQLLGEIVCWTAGARSIPYTSVVQALQDAGLNPVAKELLPRHAFSRASKKLTEERVIDPLDEDTDIIRFQFTKRVMETKGKDKQWRYDAETILSLDKSTGKVTCDIKSLEAFAQKEVIRCTEERTSGDITKIVQKLFEQNADLFPIREQGGAYFVLEEHNQFTSKIQDFLQRLGGRISRFPVPAGTANGDLAVQDSMVNGMEGLIDQHIKDIEKFGVSTRSDTLERQAGEIKETRVKIQAYASYLQDRREELLTKLDEAKKLLAKRVTDLTEERANLPPSEHGGGGGTRAYIFGYPVTAVLRALGKIGWNFSKARKVLDSNGCEAIADATIRAQVLAGHKGERGTPAELTEKQIKELEKSIKEEK